MKNCRLIILSLIILITSCKRVPPGSNSLLTSAHLETTNYTIDISKNNTIVSKQGAFINIPAGAIACDTGFVTIELAEAYTLNDMVQAGLTTQSNGIPLISEDMINIGTKQRAEVITTISAYLPAGSKRNGMNVYTGYADNEGNLNWRNPGPLNPFDKTTDTNAAPLTANRLITDTLMAPTGSARDYYYFSTTALGWYSVGKVTKGLPGFEQSSLGATISGTYSGRLHVYLVIPSEKLFLVGGPAKGKQNTYAFFTDDSKILVPHGTQAYILAMSEQDGSITYGAAEFTTAQSQNVEVKLAPVSRAEFDSATAVIGR